MACKKKESRQGGGVGFKVRKTKRQGGGVGFKVRKKKTSPKK